MAVVIDCGTDTTKVGLSGSDGPSVVFPTIVTSPSGQIVNDIKDIAVGHKVKEGAKQGILVAQCPIENGIVTDWDAMEALWHHVFDEELKISSNQHEVLLTEPPFNQEKDREKTAQIMFETFGVEGLYLGSSAVLSLYCVRRLSGLVVLSGGENTFCVPVHEGAACPGTTLKFDLAGRDVTDYLGKLLTEKGFDFSSYSDNCIREMKEKFAYVAEDFAEEMASPVAEEKYKLPDKTVIRLGKERFKCAESLFQPYLAEKDSVGIHKYVYQSIMKCDPEIREELFENIFLSGGTTLLPYFQTRLRSEVTLLAPSNVQVNVIATQDRQYAPWIGASVLAEMSTFKNMVILKQDYDEYGADVFTRKF